MREREKGRRRGHVLRGRTMIRRNLFISKLRRRLCEKGMLALGTGRKFQTGKSKFYSNVLGSKVSAESTVASS